jgi:hypothetical protein
MKNISVFVFGLFKGLKDLCDPSSFGNPYLPKTGMEIKLPYRFSRKMFLKF